ncbi:MAG TPA: uracil-DNA glycosylase [Bryobacteraceae bacterium]|nr:uracil-DNA glycosylase [Bryobacteraceae bacterium]
MDTERLRQYLEYYRDLGIQTLYRQPSAPGVAAAASEAGPAEQAERLAAPAAAAPAELPPLAPPGETLAQIREDIGDCHRCRLCEARTNIVFGVGNEQAQLVFVGEGPGQDEDEKGIPFVGRAGQLLTQMIEGTARKEGIDLKRADVYICNVVKCRPPGNRTPEADEMEMCGQFLYRQLNTIHPKAIVALGGTAARALTGHKEGVTKMRGKWFQWRDIPVMVTYHPSYLLRAYNQAAKREAWEDLKKVLHAVYD